MLVLLFSTGCSDLVQSSITETSSDYQSSASYEHSDSDNESSITETSNDNQSSAGYEHSDSDNESSITETSNDNQSSAGDEHSDSDNQTEIEPESFCEKFIFFTDPHLFLPNNSFLDDEEWFNYNIPVLKEAYDDTASQFIVCGGDLLNSGDSYSQACYKLRLFVNEFSSSFNSFYTIVGNHDTNYLGDTYMMNKDNHDCILDHETLGKVLFKSSKTYYSFDTTYTRNYCFDSWIEEDSSAMDEHKWDQVHWFANDLLTTEKEYSIVFLHIALTGIDGKPTEFMNNINSVLDAYNNKRMVEVDDAIYDYSNSFGRVIYIQAGHEHEDFETSDCCSVPVVLTTSYSFTNPTFDYVCADYQKKVIKFTRYGSGHDRIIDIP